MNDKEVLEYVERQLLLEGNGEFEWENKIVEKLYWMARKNLVKNSLD